MRTLLASSPSTTGGAIRLWPALRRATRLAAQGRGYLPPGGFRTDDFSEIGDPSVRHVVRRPTGAR